MKVLVIGATGGTGQQIVREALAQKHEVVALVRSKGKAEPLLRGATLIEGDARDPAAMGKALEGCQAVISALGTRKISFFGEVTVMSEGTRVLVAAMKQREVRRLVCITGLGAGDSAGHGGFAYDWIIKPVLLRKIYEDKDRQEGIVRASGLDWVLVRPSVLTDKPASGKIASLTDLTNFQGGSISRADVATFVVEQIRSDEFLLQTPLITGRKN